MKHAVKVRRCTVRGAGLNHRGLCVCGWVGPWRKPQEASQALLDARQHVGWALAAERRALDVQRASVALSGVVPDSGGDR